MMALLGALPVAWAATGGPDAGGVSWLDSDEAEGPPSTLLDIRAETGMEAREAIVRAACDRFRPIMMTTPPATRAAPGPASPRGGWTTMAPSCARRPSASTLGASS